MSDNMIGNHDELECHGTNGRLALHLQHGNAETRADSEPASKQEIGCPHERFSGRILTDKQQDRGGQIDAR
jgi:hypothetical protein